MADDKELIKKDLATILKLDTQLDYSQKAIVKKYYEQIVQKNLLTTTVGKKYRNKLAQIINGDAAYAKCLFCNDETSSNTVICPTCMAKLRKPSVAVNSDTNANKTNTGQTTNTTKEDTQKVVKQDEKPVETARSDTKGATKEKTLNKITSKNGKKLTKKNIAILIIILLIIIGIAQEVGLATVFSIFMLISVGFWIYRLAKKQPKKRAAIAILIFTILTGITGTNNTSKMDNNILNYIGVEENEIYKIYDKNEFVTVSNSSNLWNGPTSHNGLPLIYLNDSKPRTVCNILLEQSRGINTSFNVNGLYIGDDINQLEKWLKKMNAVEDPHNSSRFNYALTNNNLIGYYFQYNNKDLFIAIEIKENHITGMVIGTTWDNILT